MLPSAAAACPVALASHFTLSFKASEEGFHGFAVSREGTRAYAAAKDGIACFVVPKCATGEAAEAARFIDTGNNVLLDLAVAHNGNVLALLADPKSQLVSVAEYTFLGDQVRQWAVGRGDAAPGAVAFGEGYVAVALCEDPSSKGSVSVYVFAPDGTGQKPWDVQMADLHGMAIQDGMLILFGFSTISLHNLMTGAEIVSLPARDLVSGSVFRGGHIVYTDAASLLHFVEWPFELHLGSVQVPVHERDLDGDFAEILDVACSQDNVFVRTISNDVFVYQFND